jgi:hypothetical protein
MKELNFNHPFYGQLRIKFDNTSEYIIYYYRSDSGSLHYRDFLHKIQTLFISDKDYFWKEVENAIKIEVEKRKYDYEFNKYSANGYGSPNSYNYKTSMYDSSVLQQSNHGVGQVSDVLMKVPTTIKVVDENKLKLLLI